ncbi:hypothetical protein ACLMJK_003023 [Lecanora helva]
MQLSQVLVLACSSLVLATPYRHRQHSGESHRSYKPGCASPSQSAVAGGSDSWNSSVPALPYPVGGGSTATIPPPVPVSSAGGVPTQIPSPSEGGVTASSSPVAAPPTQPSSAPAQAPSSASAAAPVASSAAPVSGGGATYTASFTQYGAGDSFGSGNCNTATAACGWYSNPGFNAAASQNIFGVGPGAGAGPGCGKCFQLTAKTNPYNNNAPLTGTKSIVVKVNNLCPAQGNELCSQPTTSDKNSIGGNVNFDLCKDDGAAAALFGSSGVGAALGSATEVSCSQWSGSSNLTS